MKKKKAGKPIETDYRAFFYLGLAFTVMGIVFMVAISPGWIGFTILGVVNIAIGAAHRDQWKKRV